MIYPMNPILEVVREIWRQTYWKIGTIIKLRGNSGQFVLAAKQQITNNIILIFTDPKVHTR